MNFTKLYDWNEKYCGISCSSCKCAELVWVHVWGGGGQELKNSSIVSASNTSSKKGSTIRLSTHPVLKVNHFYYYSNKCHFFAFYGENFKMFLPKDS